MIKEKLVRFFVRTLGLSWAWRLLFGIVFPLALAAVAIAGCYALYGWVVSEIPTGQREVPFKDVLTTVLAIAALGITAFGAGAYLLLSAKIEANVRTNTDKNLWLSRSQESVDIGFVYWNFYQMCAGAPMPTRSHYLQLAILDTKQAYRWLQDHMDVKERQAERMLTIAQNNWAFYIYEQDLYEQDLALTKVGQADKETALKCVEYLEQRTTKFPELTEELVDTIQEVAGRFRPATS